MRLKITINAKNKLIPYEYHGFLQGIIYHALDDSMGSFIHDQGFHLDKRVYKMFVFSELKGTYKPSSQGLTFLEPAKFFISSISADFLNQLYIFFSNTPYLTLGNQTFEILEVESVQDVKYHESHEYILQTLSPITCYKTDEKHFTTYFHPKSQDFELSIQNNLANKYKILFDDCTNEYFHIDDIISFKEVKVKFKKSIYVAYVCKMKVHVSDGYLKLLLHTGLGARNSAGFGMVKID